MMDASKPLSGYREVLAQDIAGQPFGLNFISGETPDFFDRIDYLRVNVFFGLKRPSSGLTGDQARQLAGRGMVQT